MGPFLSKAKLQVKHTSTLGSWDVTFNVPRFGEILLWSMELGPRLLLDGCARKVLGFDVVKEALWSHNWGRHSDVVGGTRELILLFLKSWTIK